MRRQRTFDPVCGVAVTKATATNKLRNKGVEFYFCSQSCQNQFEAAPQKYAVPSRKGFWQRYLDRLNKATGGKPPTCCQ